MKMQIIEDPNYELFELSGDPQNHDNYIVKFNIKHPWITKFEMSNPKVRSAVISMIYLMAVPEVLLSPRVDNSSFKRKINEFVDSLRTRRSTQSGQL